MVSSNNIIRGRKNVMNEVIVKDEIKIENMIYEIRGKQVMLDSDLASLYECANGTKTINLAVKRHINRFPERFMFQLSDNEFKNLRFQTETSNLENEYGGRRYNPYVFTEQGVAMLATILKSKVATKVSINIMDAFVEMRKYISDNLLEQKYINDLVLNHEERINVLEATFDSFKEENNHLLFKGQMYDAYSLMIDILNKSKKSIIIIDNYLDKSLLDILSKTNKKVIVVTDKYNNDDYLKYNKEYNNVKLVINNDFHDRFIIIDESILYHCGASFKDLGNRCFEISRIDNDNILRSLLCEIGSVF